MKAFKHHESQYTDGMLARGRFRVGTLAEFRSMTDEQGSLIPDKMEGQLLATHHPIENAVPSGMLRNFVSTDGPATVKNNTFSWIIPDVYILCLSRTARNDGAYPEQRYDAVVAIEQLDEFADRMREAHPDKLGPATVADVLYIPRAIDIEFLNDHFASPFVKDTLYFSQLETRIGWEALDAHPVPFISDCPAVSRLVSRAT